MRTSPWLCAIFVAITVSSLWAKPKVDVRVKIHDQWTRDKIDESMPNLGNSVSNVTTITVAYLNVTVLSDNAEAVAQNKGQWCIVGDSLLDTQGDYQGTLDGTNLEIDVPQKNGKPKHFTYKVFDRSWRDSSAK
jgi:hypothetical protein